MWTLKVNRAFIKTARQNYFFLYFPTKTYIMGTQKNRLNDKIMGKNH